MPFVIVPVVLCVSNTRVTPEIGEKTAIREKAKKKNKRHKV